MRKYLVSMALVSVLFAATIPALSEDARVTENGLTANSASMVCSDILFSVPPALDIAKPPALDIQSQLNSIDADLRPRISSIELQSLTDFNPAHRKLWETWMKAALHFQSLRGQLPADDIYIQKMKKASEAALLKHFPRIFLTLREQIQNKAGTRLLETLEQISQIQPGEQQMGFFKVQRLITQRYDLDQYIECRD